MRNASETGESTKCPWVGVLEGTAPHPTPLILPPLLRGHFVLSPVSLASRDQEGAAVQLNDRHLRSHGKIGDCEQSKVISVCYEKFLRDLREIREYANSVSNLLAYLISAVSS